MRASCIRVFHPGIFDSPMWSKIRLAVAVNHLTVERAVGFFGEEGGKPTTTGLLYRAALVGGVVEATLWYFCVDESSDS